MLRRLASALRRYVFGERTRIRVVEGVREVAVREEEREVVVQADGVVVEERKEEEEEALESLFDKLLEDPRSMGRTHEFRDRVVAAAPSLSDRDHFRLCAGRIAASDASLTTQQASYYCLHLLLDRGDLGGGGGPARPRWDEAFFFRSQARRREELEALRVVGVVRLRKETLEALLKEVVRGR